MQPKLSVVEGEKNSLSTFPSDPRNYNMSFVWLTKESSAVLRGQMNNIAAETLITNAGDLLKGPVEVRRQMEEE